MSICISYQDIRLLGAEEREALLESGGGPIVWYDSGDETHRPALLLGEHGVPESEMVTEELICVQCLTKWTGRYPAFFEGLACPRCEVLCGAPLAEHEASRIGDIEG
jgi:hypothetical protein